MNERLEKIAGIISSELLELGSREEKPLEYAHQRALELGCTEAEAKVVVEEGII